jgi:hypothetical protein
MRAAVGTDGAARLVVVRSCGWLKNRRGTVCAGVRGNRRAGSAHARGVRLRSQCWRRTRARLRHLVAHVRRYIHATHVCIVSSLTVHARNNTSRHSVSGRERHVTVARRGSIHRRGVLRVVATIRASGPAWCRSTRCKGSSSSGGSLFHRASVVVLVAGQGSATRESLLTIGIRALIWSLARMNATMSRKRT